MTLVANPKWKEVTDATFPGQTANDRDDLICRVIKMKLEAKKEKSGIDFTRGLDDIIHFLVTDERFQIYKNTSTDSDIIWLYETADEEGKKNL